MRMPTMDTERLRIRPFRLDDLDDVHRVLDVELADADVGTEGAMSREQRERWLNWTTMGYDELARLNQPPYGERAIVQKDVNELIGVIGYVPCLDAFGQLAALAPALAGPAQRLFTTEFGLYWAMSPAYQNRGFATEAARALIDYAFSRLRVLRVVATTHYDNAASIGVMRKLGMLIERNPFPDPPWLQIVGVRENPEALSGS
ncbi:MAG: family acetyltransferase [Chloroflexi bacterium]|nr:family acetyltransferase [Chloroflexota bacterium]MDB5078054.1 family acetyltransferase [Chloroflexota bacterium]